MGSELMDCPNCSSSHVKRCEMLYAQGTSVSYGTDSTSFNISGLASRVSPPAPPLHPRYFKRRLFLLGVPGLLLCLIAVAFFLLMLDKRGPSFAAGALIPGILGGYLLWQAWPPPGALDKAAHDQRYGEYMANLRLYSMLWACLDCGHVFKPSGGSNSQ
ncbi:hypothetical protein [Hydrogenophaga atypica]|uniref:Transmembrane protein n=1 Tax=Hydrogenophaga atypica TaxID=249409 RepID=A0ABW2QSN6_9BURK